jgi:hypothetical protein
MCEGRVRVIRGSTGELARISATVRYLPTAAVFRVARASGEQECEKKKVIYPSGEWQCVHASVVL